MTPMGARHRMEACRQWGRWLAGLDPMDDASDSVVLDVVEAVAEVRDHGFPEGATLAGREDWIQATFANGRTERWPMLAE